MKVETKTVEIKTITADKGMVLTNGEIYSEVGGSIYLSSNDSANNYYEITEEEYNAIAKEEQAKMEATLKEMQ